MSGIVGIVNLDGAPVDRELLWSMTRHLAPRGPDAQEVWVQGPVGLGHTMLRTTRESAVERQPRTLDGVVWITADCRVDAREELVRQLASLGAHVPPSAPDVELILHAYAVWGEQCVDHLLGDFSFAIWDGRRRTLFCARDHLGVKAFHYVHAPRTFVFSNTLTCLRLHDSVSIRLDEVAAADYLLFGGPLDLDRSMFADIRRLPPAHTLTVTAATVRVRRYWDMPLDEEVRYKRRADYLDRFRELFEVAVRDRLRTNRVGVLMSGGLDSPAVAATAKRLLQGDGAPFDLRAHTVVFDRLVPDEERKYSQIAADFIGIPVHHQPVDDYRFPPATPDPPWYPPEPRTVFDRGRAIAILRGPAEASRVLLRGDGADPLLLAPPFALEKACSEGKHWSVLRDFLWLLGTRRQVPRFGIRTLVRKWAGRGSLSSSSYPDWIQPDLERRLDLRHRWLAEQADPPKTYKGGHELRHAYWARVFEVANPGTMQLPAEVRFPFVDLRLVRYLLQVPALPWGIDKNLLRLAMRDRLPTEVLRRPKAPAAGNPWVRMLPPARTRWWEAYLVPEPGLERFVRVEVAGRRLAEATVSAELSTERRHLDTVHLALRPVCLNLWLRDSVRANSVFGSHRRSTRRSVPMMEKNMEKNTGTKPTAKAPYAAPRLAVYGDLRSITLNKRNEGSDNGVDPNDKST